MQRNNEGGFKDLSIYGHGSTSTDLPFSAIHGDLVTEHFNRETKGTAGPFRSSYSTDLQALKCWIKSSHIHVLPQRIDHPQQTSTLEHVQKLKRALLDYGTGPIGTGPAQNLVTGKEIDGDLVKGFLDNGKTGNKAYLNFVNQWK